MKVRTGAQIWFVSANWELSVVAVEAPRPTHALLARRAFGTATSTLATIAVIRSFASFIDSTTAPNYSPLKRGDVVFAASGETHGEIGKAAVYCGREDAFAGADTVIFTPTTRLDPMFLGYAANTKDAERFKSRFGQGSSVIHISVQHLRDLPIFLPALPEQRRIAEILDTLDEVIRHTEQVIAKLQQMKQGLLHDLLTRGIDDNGELRDPVRHPEQFKDSPLGRIPKKWRWGALGSVLESAVDGPFGSSLKTNHYVREGVRIVRLQNIGSGLFHDTDRAFISEQYAGSLARHQVVPGDLLVASLGDQNHPIARACLYPHDFNVGIVKADCFRLRPLQSAAEAGFLMMALNCPATRIDIPRLSQGVTRDRINLGNLKRVCVPLPSINEQRNSLRLLGAAESRLHKELSGAERYRLLKRGLMDDLLTGRVRVKVPQEAA